MRPLEGDAFLHSQMKETPGLPSARSKAKSPLGRASARRRSSSGGRIAFAARTRSRAWSAN